EQASWQSVEINGTTYLRASKANATSQESDLLITIPVSYRTDSYGQIELSDSIQVAGRLYVAGCMFRENEGLDWDFTSAPADDVGNSMSEATELVVPIPTSTTIPESNISDMFTLGQRDIDYFKLVIEHEMFIGIRSVGTTDLHGTLMSEDKILHENDDFEGDAWGNFVVYAGVQPGTYYVSVRGYSRETFGHYALSVATLLPEKGSAKPTTKQLFNLP
ncbi:MAG: hypothetical protein OXG88_04125, partial [Gammaproteobacteria bacterium]|nr:hypothetical protein [Gammaproteobacteria bacterium]